MSGNPL